MGQSPRTLRFLEDLIANDEEFKDLNLVIGTTRCQSECASGPNVKLLPEGAVVNECRDEEACREALRRLVAYERCD